MPYFIPSVRNIQLLTCTPFPGKEIKDPMRCSKEDSFRDPWSCTQIFDSFHRETWRGLSGVGVIQPYTNRAVMFSCLDAKI